MENLNKLDSFKTIKLGGNYRYKYLSPNEENSEEIPTKKGFVKSYLITNKEDQQIFKGILNILPNGSAIMNVDYKSHSGVRNKYVNYFDKDGNEIIDVNNSTEKEYAYFKSL